MKSNICKLIAILPILAGISFQAVGKEKDKENKEAISGQALFAKKCGQCHSFAEGKNGNGPSLFQVLNRPAASVPGFKYSRAMRQIAKDEALTWNEETLFSFLAQPSQLIPGTRMAFPGLKDEASRTALVQWIKESSGPYKPAP